MFRTLRSRLLLTYLLVSSLVLILVGVGLMLSLVRGPLGSRLVYLRLHELADRITEDAALRLIDLEPARLQPLTERMNTRYGVRVLVVDIRDGLIADSQRNSAPLSTLSPRSAGSESVEGEFEDSSGETWRFVSIQLNPSRTLLLAAQKPALRVIIFLGSELLQPLARIGILALITSIVLAWLVSLSVVRPLKSMNAAMRKIAGGRFDKRLPLQGSAEMKEAAQAFNDMVERVAASQQMERDFVANVSHELKTPLTSIQGYALAILDGTAGDEKARIKAATVINTEAQRLHRLVLDLLDLARMDSGQIKFERSPVEPGILLTNITDKFQIKADEKGVVLEKHLALLPVIVGDGDRLAQVFTNLIDNALKYAPDNSHISVSAQVEQAQITVKIRDFGPGIPEKDLSRIFERFYQVDKSRARGKADGSGLGLAISKEIIEAHNGQLFVESTPGEGSCFTVCLPIIQPGDQTLNRPRKKV
ncbi:MAG: HAMP domain-containing protein [Anaerolineales bacterium]|nr:HAMP domain-containing protein [Anaerolineales bacterium]